jgi:hypothetical protein
VVGPGGEAGRLDLLSFVVRSVAPNEMRMSRRASWVPLDFAGVLQRLDPGPARSRPPDGDHVTGSAAGVEALLLEAGHGPGAALRETTSKSGAACSTASTCSAYAAQSVATCSRPPARSREATSSQNAGETRRRLPCRSLRPRVGEEGPHLRQGRRRHHGAQEHQRIAVGDPDVGQPAGLDQLEQVPGAGGVDVDREHVDLRLRRRHPRGRLAHAEADLEHHGAARPNSSGRSSGRPSTSTPYVGQSRSSASACEPVTLPLRVL